jgi:small subunit ribosomal protein S15
LNKEKSKEIVESFGQHAADPGATEVQIALLTERINELTTHLAANPHDFNTQRGLLVLVGQRRRLLSYLSKKNVLRYHSLIKRLGLRK